MVLVVQGGNAPSPTLSPAEVAAGLREGLARRGLDTDLAEACQGWWVSAGRRAYKLLKARPDEPAAPGARLARRREALAAELRLNAALAPALYLRVLCVHVGPQGLMPGGPGPAVDAAMQVRRLGAADLASGWLARGALDTAALARLARTLARFHHDAPPAPGGPNAPDPLATQADAARQALRALPADAALPGWIATKTRACAHRQAQRLPQVHLREAHGDLHLAHLAHDGAAFVPIGRVLPAPARRWADTMVDVAGLVMDLWAHGRRDLAFAFLDAYLQASGDHDGVDQLPLLLVLRAIERAKALAWREDHGRSPPGLQAADYLNLASRLAHDPSPRLLLVHGGTGTERGRVVQQLLERAGALRVHRHTPAPGAAAADDDDALVQHVEACLRAGYPTIVDGPPAGRRLRDRLRRIAADHGAPWAVLDAHPDGPGLDADELAQAIAWTPERPTAMASLLARWLGAPA